MEKHTVDTAWHLDKKVPIGLILGISIQTIVLVYFGTTWKSDIDHRLNTLEKTANSSTNQGDRILVLENELLHTKEYQVRIETTLSRIENMLEGAKTSEGVKK